MLNAELTPIEANSEEPSESPLRSPEILRKQKINEQKIQQLNILDLRFDQNLSNSRGTGDLIVNSRYRSNQSPTSERAATELVKHVDHLTKEAISATASVTKNNTSKG